jgi:hypothetical protein
VILENLSFASLVEPFQMNGVSGKAISRIKSYREVMDMARNKISKVVAETFFEDYVLDWQSTGRIPRDLLKPFRVPTSSLKVLIFYYVYSHLFVSTVCMHLGRI